MASMVALGTLWSWFSRSTASLSPAAPPDGQVHKDTENAPFAERMQTAARRIKQPAPPTQSGNPLSRIPAGQSLWRRRVRIEHTQDALHAPQRF